MHIPKHTGRSPQGRGGGKAEDLLDSITHAISVTIHKNRAFSKLKGSLSSKISLKVVQLL